MLFGADSLLSRRNVMIGAGVAGSALLAPELAFAQATKSSSNSGYKFDDPAEMLKLYCRLYGSLDGKPVFGWYSGHAFGNVPGEIIRPLVGFEGFGCGWVKAQPDGTFKNAWKEVGYYKDLRTGEILDTWTNPYTQEKCDVLHIHNSSVNMVLSTKLPDYAAMAAKGMFLGNPNYTKLDDAARPYGLPYAIAGDTISLFSDARGNVPNRLNPKEWPRESTGERINVAEFYMMSAKVDQALNPNVMNAATTGAWTRIGPWLPWMMMGGKPGELYYRSATKKLTKAEELPRHIIAYTEKHYPTFLTPPSDGDFNTPMESSWDVFKRERKPKPANVTG